MCDLLLKFNHNKMYVGSWSNIGWQFCESKVHKVPWSYTRFGLRIKLLTLVPKMDVNCFSFCTLPI